MKEIKNLQELERLLNGEIKEVIMDNNSMSNTLIREEISDITKDMVYERYNPVRYKRRGDSGGLSDINNISAVEGEIVDNSTTRVSFEQAVTGNFTDEEYTEDLASTINEGWGDKEREYEKPSKHLDYLRENLGSRVQNDIPNAIKFDLHSKGYHIK